MRIITLTICVLLYNGICFGETQVQAVHSLVEQARGAHPERYEYAISNGAAIHPTLDGKSFYVLWYPPHPEDKLSPMIVTIHGHGSFAFDEFYLWHAHAEKKGYGILAIQWWLGKGERFQDYLSPREIYTALDEVFKKEGIGPDRALFHGFSRGSANSYAVAALDRYTGNNYFSLFIANSGKPGLDFPSNVDIEKGLFGAQPLAGTRWVTYAGALDTHPERDGYEGMRQARTWIEKYGGQVVLAIEDPEGGHGGFHRHSQNTETALEIFEKLIK